MARARIKGDEAEMVPFGIETHAADGHSEIAGYGGRGGCSKSLSMWLVLGVVCLGVLCVAVLRMLWGEGIDTFNSLEFARPNDLWGIHDLLLAGYAGIFMEPNTKGWQEVRESSMRLTALLPAIHPSLECRERLARSLGGTAGSPLTNQVSEELHLKAVSETWACLPAEFKPDDFKNPLLPDAIGDFEAYKAARMTQPLYPPKGVCEKSAWPRTCSFWVSMHLMAARADQLSLGVEFLEAVVPILAGGATFCGGCTRHFRALTKPVLSSAVLADLATVF